MRIEKMGSKSDVVVKLVLVFFVTLLSFSIGTFVGKKYSDNQHELAQLEPGQDSGHAARSVASAADDAHGAHGETKATSSAMSDEEIAKLAEEFVADETESPAKALETEAKAALDTKLAEHVKEEVKAEVAGHKSTTTVAAKEEALADASHVSQQLAAGYKPTETVAVKKDVTKTDRIPSSLPKNVAQYTVGKFTVQVASFADEGEAQKIASDLKTKGYSAFYIPAEVKGKTWYRVSVGQFATQKEATSYRAELLDKVKVSSAIVQRITE